MALPHVAAGDPHVSAHNDERDAIDDVVDSLSAVAISGDYSDLDGKPTLGTAAGKNVGTTAGTVAAGDDSRIVGAAQTTSLGTASTKNVGNTAGTVAAGDDPRFGEAAALAGTLGTASTKNTGTASGEVPLLGAGGLLPVAQMASGTPTGAKFIRDDGVLAVPAGGGGGGTGDVVGPASSTTGNLPTFSSGTGKAIQDSGVPLVDLAPLASPVFTGNPEAPTAAATDDDTSVATTAHVKDAIQGGAVISLGTTVNGAVSLSTFLDAATAVNANLTATLTGHTTFTAATMPAVAAGTQFVLTVVQGGSGSYTLTLTNIKKPGGAVGLVLSTGVGAEDQIVFYYNGSNWYAAFSGKAWAI